MTDLIRECMLDMPLCDMNNRPEGMLAVRRADVPEEVRPVVDAWIEAHGGHVASEPLIVVHNGKTPPGSGGQEFYVFPPEALAEPAPDA